ncbi:MAG TPA: phosphotransferase, partial [Acidimicrobiales bacterium]
AESFVERYRSQLDHDVTATLEAVSDAIIPWGLTGLEPFSLVHGDYRLDNLLFPAAGDGVVAVDWQTAAIGPPLRDVAYLLGTSLEPADRRTHEEAIVAGYHAGLVAAGVTGYSAERCWDDYRLGLLQGPLISIIGCIYATGVRSEASDAMFLSIVRRSCAAIAELGSLDLIPADIS